jgi:RNA polymerase sigma-70 factor, ECF subfamily
MASREFHDQLIQFLPKMRVWALGLTRNATAADDLVQDVALKTLVANETFIPGTNFSAWVHRIMVNHFISAARRARETGDIEQVPEMAVAASQQESTDLREVSRAFRRLPEDQKYAFRSIVIEEKSYQQTSRRERPGDRYIEEPGSPSPPATTS